MQRYLDAFVTYLPLEFQPCCLQENRWFDGPGCSSIVNQTGDAPLTGGRGEVVISPQRALDLGLTGTS